MSDTIQKEKIPFTMVPNTVLTSTHISFKAMGIYAYLNSKPDGWNFTVNSIAAQVKEGRASILKGIQELKSNGFVEYYKKSDGSGVYHLLQQPKSENPTMGVKPKSEKATVRKSDCINKNIPTSNNITIVEYLNKKAGKRYKVGIKKTDSLINARINEGFTVDDFKLVIDAKINDWGDDDNMSKFLRPETLFGTKFEGYVNEKQKAEGFDYAKYNK